MSAVAAAVPEPDPESMSGLGSGVRRAAPTDAGFGLDERASLELCVADPTTFDAGTVLEFLVRVQAEESRWAAKRVRLLADLAARDSSEDRWVAEEVGAALRWSPTRAMRAVKEASQLHDQLPATFAKLAAGVLTPRQATLVTEASYRLPDRDSVAALDQVAATHCAEQSEPETSRFVNRQVLRADPNGAERRHRRAVTDRHVRLTAADDGMALLSALLPAPEAVACFQRLDTAARRHRQEAQRSTPGATGVKGAQGGQRVSADPRTMDQLRADLFTRALLNTGAPTADTSYDTGDRANDAGAGFGLGASVQVIVSAATLLGQDDEPGWLDRYGPITADTARRIAHRHLAAAGHRPRDGPAHRRRDEAVSAAGRGPPARRTAGRDLPFPVLQPPGHRLRPRSCRSVPGGADHCRQSARGQPAAPPGENPHEVAGQPRSGHRRDSVDQPHRPQTNHPAAGTLDPARRHPEPTTARQRSRRLAGRTLV